MRLLSFGNCVDRAAEEVLVGFLDLKMFGGSTKKWFARKQKRQQPQKAGRRPCARRKKRWAAKILKEHREQILSELDVNAVLPYLVFDKVFSLGEYKEIVGQVSSRRRTEVFLDHLTSKGPAAFSSFCSVLEEVCPHLLTCFLLDGEGTPTNYPLIQLNKNRTAGGVSVSLSYQSVAASHFYTFSSFPYIRCHLAHNGKDKTDTETNNKNTKREKLLISKLEPQTKSLQK